MDDFYSESFADVPTKLDQTIWPVLNSIGEVTPKHIAIVFLSVILLRFVINHKRILGEVRSTLLTIPGVLSGVVHAILAFGLYRILP